MRISRRLGLYAGAEGGGITLPTYTGSYAIFGDAVQGYIELYSSGTLSLAKANYQVFALGGGGGGSSPYDDGEGNIIPGGGGGGGYTTTAALNLAADTSYTVMIGAGGAKDANGGATSISNITAEGGYKGTYNNGGTNGSWGGSGGGEAGTTVKAYRTGGTGGSDGSWGYGNNHDIKSSGNYFHGQGTTTRAFGEVSGTLYAGGGGGGGAYASGAGNRSSGGEGGGGQGGNGANSSYAKGLQADNNTGGGGGGGGGSNYGEGAPGGSGRVIVRWGYAA